jgi:hypothetical protein
MANPGDLRQKTERKLSAVARLITMLFIRPRLSARSSGNQKYAIRSSVSVAKRGANEPCAQGV